MAFQSYNKDYFILRKRIWKRQFIRDINYLILYINVGEPLLLNCTYDLCDCIYKWFINVIYKSKENWYEGSSTVQIIMVEAWAFGAISVQHQWYNCSTPSLLLTRDPWLRHRKEAYWSFNGGPTVLGLNYSLQHNKVCVLSLSTKEGYEK